jgi:hypothetical protein
MSLLKPFRSVIPVANNDTATYYVSLQPVACGSTDAKFVSANLTFQPSTQTLSVNKSTIQYSNTRSVFNLTPSPTPPTSPKIGDLWYDTSTDIQFEYIFDGVNNQWVDISSPLIPGTVQFVYKNAVGYANANIAYALADSVNNYSNTIVFSVNTVNITDGSTIYWRDVGTANNYTKQFPRFADLANSGNVTIFNNANTTFSRTAIDDFGKFIPPGNNTTMQLAFYSCASFSSFIGSSNAVPIIDNSTRRETYQIQYFVLGGGGGGGSGQTGNGGAGGGGGGGIVCGILNTEFGVTYSISVGTGGWQSTSQLNSCAAGTLGNNSTITGTGTIITARGGGGGGGQGTVGPAAGGSGGGGRASGVAGSQRPGSVAAQPGQPQTLPAGSTSTNRGFPGGDGYGPRAGGGGGGAGAIGGSAPAGGTTTGGTGGAGYTWPLNGTTYGGGGGGGSDAPAGGGGPGGGGAGSSSATPATAGTNNLGGGGGGTGQFSPAFGAKGGHGIVILAVPNLLYLAPKFPGAIVSNPPAAPGMTVLSYTAPTPGSTPGTYTFSS